MPESDYDDPTIPPPGKRAGDGLWSIVPFLQKSIATKVQAQPEDVPTVPPVDMPPPPPKNPQA